MLKHKKILLLSLIAPFSFALSCAKAKEPYELVRQWFDGVDETEFRSHLDVSGPLSKTEYKSGETLDISGLTIKVNGKDGVRANKEDIYNDGTFFVCENHAFPTNTVIGIDYKATSNVESADLTFYIAAAIKIGDTYKVYVAGVKDQFYKVTIKNDNAIKPWVWYTVTGVVVFAVVGMVMLTRRYKSKKESGIQ